MARSTANDQLCPGRRIVQAYAIFIFPFPPSKAVWVEGVNQHQAGLRQRDHVAVQQGCEDLRSQKPVFSVTARDHQ